MQKEFSRSQRMGSLILRTLNEVIHRDVDDPALQDITLSDIELSQDLSIAKIYFSSLKYERDMEIPSSGLKRASSFLRKKLGSAIKVRHVPELRFFYDQSTAKSMEISELIKNSKKSK